MGQPVLFLEEVSVLLGLSQALAVGGESMRGAGCPVPAQPHCHGPVPV